MRALLYISMFMAALAGCGGDSKPSAPRELDLRVVSYNLRNKEDWWEDRLVLTADQFVALAPDIAGFQEVSTQVMQLEALVAAIGEREGAPEYESAMTLKPEPYASLTGEALGTLTQRKILESDVLYLSMGRVVSFERLDVGGGRRLDFYNTHLHPGGDGADIRTEQVMDALDFISKHDEGWPTFFTGDFNATPDEGAIMAMLDAGFVDTCATVNADDVEGLCNTSPVTLAREPVDQDFYQRIDFIFFQPGSKLESFDLVDSHRVFDEPGPDGLYPSDHLGVVTDFHLAFE